MSKRMLLIIWLVATASLQAESTSVTQAAQSFQERGGRVVRADTVPGKPITIVDLHRVAIGDADVKALAEMTALEVLDLSYTQITDATLAVIAKLPKLKQLSLYGTKITDNGLANLAKLDSLESLFLAETNIGDAGLKHLSSLTNLQSLELDHTKITTLDALGNLKKLRRLEVHHNRGLNDVGVQALARLPALSWVDLHKTAVSDVAVRRLQPSLPKTRIVR